MSPHIDKMIRLLRSFQDRKKMYVQPVDLANVQSFLCGFAVGCLAADFDLPYELRDRAQESRGWNLSHGLGPVPQMRERGMSDEEIMDELIEIEVLRLQLLGEGTD
jgi:hypothetical protein